MRILWNPVEKMFEAEFQSFQDDLDAVKTAGFKTDGPPSWKWRTNKVSVLDKLRKNRPASGLTIMTDALAEYHKLCEVEKTNKEVKQALKKAKKEQQPEIDYDDCNYKSDYIPKYIPPIHPGPFCVICAGPVYFYELQNPPCCIWCEKLLDNFLGS